MSDKKLRVWHCPQVPCDPFYVEVESPHEGMRILSALADYDIFHFENKIKPDFCNASGLQELNGDQWLDWHDADGNDIHECDYL